MQLSRLGEYTLMIIAMLTIMAGAALAPGLQSIAAELNFADMAPLLITLPALGAILFAPFFGQLIDTVGARKTLLMALVGYGLFGVGGMYADGVAAVAIDRVLLGGLAAGVMASGTAVISLWYHGKDRLNVIAKQGMAIELGGVVFLFVGGFLAEWTWQGPFLLYALAFICILLTLAFIPKKAPQQPDEWEHSEHPELPVPNQRMRGILVNTLLAMALFFSLVVTLPELLGERGFSEPQTGFVLSFMSFIAVLSALVMPKVVRKTSDNATVAIAFFSLMVAHSLFAFGEATAFTVVAAVFAGIGFGFSIPLLNHATVERSKETNRGKNLAMFAMAVFSGQFITSGLGLIPAQPSSALYGCAALALVCGLSRVTGKTL